MAAERGTTTAKAAGFAAAAAVGLDLVKTVFGEGAVERGRKRVLDKLNIREAWSEIEQMVSDIHRTLDGWPIWHPSVTETPEGKEGKPKGMFIGGQPKLVAPEVAERCKQNFAALVERAKREHRFGTLRAVFATRWQHIADNVDETDSEPPRHAMKRWLVQILSEDNLEKIWNSLMKDAENLGVISKALASAEDSIAEARANPGTPPFTDAAKSLKRGVNKLRKLNKDLAARVAAKKGRRSP